MGGVEERAETHVIRFYACIIGFCRSVVLLSAFASAPAVSETQLALSLLDRLLSTYKMGDYRMGSARVREERNLLPSLTLGETKWPREKRDFWVNLHNYSLLKYKSPDGLFVPHATEQALEAYERHGWGWGRAVPIGDFTLWTFPSAHRQASCTALAPLRA